MEEPVEYIWHKEKSLSGFDALILPGGFSYGDYLRTGAIARFSPIMPAFLPLFLNDPNETVHFPYVYDQICHGLPKPLRIFSLSCQI
jgi:hypothetical protein